MRNRIVANKFLFKKFGKLLEVPDLGVIRYSVFPNYLYIDSIKANHEGSGSGSRLMLELALLARSLGKEKILGRQDDGEGRPWKMRLKIPGSKSYAYVSLKDAEDLGLDDLPVINHPQFGEVVRVDEEMDPSTISPIFLETILI